MNILLVNIPFKANHGGILQSYALQHLLEGWGHRVVKAEERKHRQFHWSFRQLALVLKRMVKGIISRQPLNLLPELDEDKRLFLPIQHASAFVSRYIHTIPINHYADLDGSQYDAVIVGSDQVWRRLYNYGALTTACKADNSFLAFTAGWNCRRIAYAASFGVDKWEYTVEETQVLQQLIRQFDAVSVREDSAVGLVHDYLDNTISVEHVLDPTLLIPREAYEDLALNTDTKPSAGNLLLYILDQSDIKRQFIQKFTALKGMTPFYVNNPKCENDSYPPEERIQVPIEQWLRGFMEADFVLADSFHACVFSLIFQKPFLVLANPDRGNTRLESLMKMFGLANRIIDASNPDFDLTNVPEIDWIVVNKRMTILREKSIQFLKIALNE